MELPLSDEDRRHAASALRVRPGEEIEVVEPAPGSVWRVEVAQVSSAGIRALPIERLERPFHPRVTLVQGVAKGDKMDAIVRQAVEIGAAEVVPVLTARSVVRLDAKKRHERGERWRRIAKSAAEQSHRAEVPAIHDPVTLHEALPVLAGYDEVIVLWEDASALGLSRALASRVSQPETRVALVVGPEGGLAANEVEELAGIGAQVVSLGPLILRTETAALVALALAAFTLGGLGSDC